MYQQVKQMITRNKSVHTRQDLRQANGVLLILREPPPALPPTPGQPAFVAGNPLEGEEILLALWDDGSVTGLHGHVDLGTGIRTALAQIIAEELYLPIEQVHIILGSTGIAPNQGATIASASIQIHAIPLRKAAAQIRHWLITQASIHFSCHPSQIQISQGTLFYLDKTPINFGDLIKNNHFELALADDVDLKSISDYTIVGTSVPRVDIPAKATGELTFVHDIRLPGMLHGRVIRPPYAGADHGEFIGKTLDHVDRNSIAHIPGIVEIFTQGDFIGVVAEREEYAEQAMHELRVVWKSWPALPSVEDLTAAIKANPSTKRIVKETGDVEHALQNAAIRMQRHYVWPYQLHASIGPSCAVAQWLDKEQLQVWAGTQNPHVLRKDLSTLTGLPDVAIEIIRMEASGCYGRNCADDVAGDAVLLSRAVGGRPVRVQLTREQENLWEPKGAAQLMEVDGGLDQNGSIAAYDFAVSYPSNGAPLLALLITGLVPAQAIAYEMGDRTAVPPYDIEHLRVTIHDMAPILRASWLRGVSALPNSFAHESYIDELATEAGVDPLEFRLRYLSDPRATELLKTTADKAGWESHISPRIIQDSENPEILKGQGIAYARYIHSRFPGFGAAWAAWVADVEVNKNTGQVHVSRVVVGHDAGLMINPAGVAHQIHGNVIQTTSRALKESMSVEPIKNTVISQEWGTYPILNFREVPTIDVVMIPRPNEQPQGAGESSSVPGTAAIANAIFDATGIRFREPPFTPEKVRAAFQLKELPAPPPTVKLAQKGLWKIIGALGIALMSFSAAMLGGKNTIPSITQLDRSIFTDQLIERGKNLMALGNCQGCHTNENGQVNAGGRSLETPFGVVYSTNITPDLETGIGTWSFSAFQRAMQHGISKDGSYLYPAFPYTSYAKMTEEDVMSLYAFLMAQKPIFAPQTKTELTFPFNIRPLMVFWNALFLNTAELPHNPKQSVQWSRGAYLVNTVGHCTACHSPRNILGAEKSDSNYLSGNLIDGWEAPALNQLNQSPIAWDEAELYRYLRTGITQQHGMAGGPMAGVVTQLSSASEADVQAMAHYLSTINNSSLAERLKNISDIPIKPIFNSGQRIFEMACSACHQQPSTHLINTVESGSNIPLQLNSQLHSERPDNLIRTILDGINRPATDRVGYMPAFKNSLSNQQIADLINYMREHFAPDKNSWTGLEPHVKSLRK